ncbi:MAG: NFACT family protein [Chloroflexia bacterium]|nr:NFACT family protein [Chloroflexia bacterium]
MFDVLTMAAIADELSRTVLDGRVQRIGLVDPLTVAMEIYARGRRHALVASAGADRPRIHLVERLPSLDPALITPLGLQLRKFVRGGVIVGIEQQPLERVVRLSIAKRLTPHNDEPRPRAGGNERTGVAGSQTANEIENAVPGHDSDGSDRSGWEDEGQDDDSEGESDATFVHLVVEVMGRHSNLILLDDEGLVKESAKHVSPRMSRVRPIRPKTPYTPPPPQERPDPRRLTGPIAAALLETQAPSATVVNVLVRQLRAISPAMAREIVFRTTGAITATVADLGADDAATLARETRALLEPMLTDAWAPVVYRRDDLPVEYAPVPMAHLAASADPVPTPSISRAAELVEVDPGGDDAATMTHAQRRARLTAAIDAAAKRIDQRIASLEAQEAKSVEAEHHRIAGETIYAYLWQLKPGDTTLEVDGTTIALDPGLSGKENAQAYFQRYQKARGASRAIPELMEKAQTEAAYLDQARTQVAQASSFADLEALAAEWEAHGGTPVAEPGRKPGKSSRATKRPKAVLTIDGHAIFVGRSGRDNDAVTFDLAGPDDTWLHARGVPGSHVIVRWRQQGQAEDERTIGAAASLAAYYSSARTSATVEVDATRRRHVRRIKGAGPGMVTYRNEYTVSVRPASERELEPPDSAAPVATVGD